MSMTIQQGASAPVRSGPVPGLGTGSGEDQISSASEEGRDFASVMRDLSATGQEMPVPGQPKAKLSKQEKAALSESVDQKAISAERSVLAPDTADKPRKSVEKKLGKTEETIDADAGDGVKAQAPATATPIQAELASAVAPVPSPVPAEEEVIEPDGGITRKVAVVQSAAVRTDRTALDLPGQVSVPADAEAKIPDAVPEVNGDLKASEASPAVSKADGKELKSSGKNNIQDIEKQIIIQSKIKNEPRSEAVAIAKEMVGAAVKADVPAKPGEATALLSIAGEKAKISIKTNGEGGSLSTDANAQAVAPVRGEGNLTPQDKVIKGLRVAAEHAAPEAAVVSRVAAALAAAETASTERTGDIADAAQGDFASTADADNGEAAPREARRSEGASFAARLDVANAPAMAAAPNPVQPGSHPALNLAGALGQQVVDLGVTGQWIEDIARNIASVAANPGHGSFRVASEMLGAVRVDITPGTNGSDIVMTVDNEMAHAALAQDRQRLLQDAQLASIRLGEVRIDRVAPMADAHRGDMGNGGQQPGSGNSQSAAQAALGQSMGQTMSQNGGQQGGRGDAGALAQQNGGNNAKAPFTRTVLNDAASPEAADQGQGRRTDRARYA